MLVPPRANLHVKFLTDCATGKDLRTVKCLKLWLDAKQGHTNGAHWSCGYDADFWIQRLTVGTLTSVCCILEQDTLSALLQSTQL